MSRQIDERVVSMQFDNRNFESNVKTSLSTLDKLKQSLNFKGTQQEFANLNSSISKVDMSPLANSVETVRMKFSALEVMAVTALANITNKAVDAGQRLVKSLSTDQIMTGWNKYEQKTSSVQTIMNATGKSIDEVSGYLDKLMWYSDETSYGFTDMTSSLAQLTSAGGDIDKLIPMIEGIANATAFAGKGAAEFSRAIYNLNQSYSTGALKYMDWKSLDLAGVSSKQLKQTFIDTAIALGKLDSAGRTANGTLVEIGNFGQTLSENWADTTVMEQAFGKFAELTEEAYKLVDAGVYKNATDAIAALSGQYDEVSVKAFKAAQEAKSFTEAIEATKDAVSSQWMKTMEIIFGNKVEATKIWTELCDGLWDIFASSGENRNDLLDEALGSKWTKFSKKLGEAGISTDEFEEKIISLRKADEDLAKQWGNDMGSIDDIIEEYGSLKEAIDAGAIEGIGHYAKKAFESLGISLDSTAESTENLADKYAKLEDVVQRVWNGDYGNGAERFAKLIEEGFDDDLVQALVNATAGLEDHKIKLDQLSDSQLQSIGLTDEQIAKLREVGEAAGESGVNLSEALALLDNKPSGRWLLIDSFRNILGGLKDVLETVKKAWSEVFPPKSAEDVYNLVEAVHNFTEAIRPSTETLSKISRIFKGLFSILGIVADIFKELATTIFGSFSDGIGDANLGILDFLANIGDGIVKFRTWLNEENKLSDGIKYLCGVIGDGVSKIKAFVDKLKSLESVQKLISNINDLLQGNENPIKNWIDGFKEVEDIPKYIFDGLINGLQTGIKTLWNIAVDVAKCIYDAICDFFDINSPSKVMMAVGGFIIAGLLAGLLSGSETLATEAANIGSTILNAIRGVFGITGDESSALSETGESAAQGLLDGFLDRFRNFNWGKAFAGVISAGLLIVVMKLANAVENVTSVFEGVGDILTNVAGVIKKAGKVLNAVSFNLKAKAVKEIAIAIGILAGAVVVLSFIPEEDLKRAVHCLGLMIVTFGLLAIALAVISKVVNKTESLKDIGSFKIDVTLTKLGLALMAIATSLLIFSGVMAILNHINFDDGILKMGGMLVVIGLFVGIAGSLIDDKQIDIVKRITKVILQIALSLLVLTVAIKIIGSLRSDELVTGALFAGGLLAFVSLLTLVSECVDKGNSDIGSTMLKLAAALVLMAVAVKLIGKLSVDELTTGVAFVGGFLIFVTILAFVCERIEKVVSGFGKAVLELAAALLLVTVVIGIIGALRWETALQGVLGVVVLTGLLYYVIKGLSKIEKDLPKIGLTLLAMAGALAILAGVSVVLSLVPFDSLMKAVAAIVFLAAGMAIMIKYTKDAKDIKGSIMAMAVAIGVMGVVVTALSFIPWDDAIVAVASLVALMAMFGVMIYCLGQVKEIKGLLGPLIVLTVAIGLIGGIVFLLAKFTDTSDAFAAAVSIGVIILALAGALKIIADAGTVATNAIVALGVLAASMTILGLIVYMLAQMDSNSVITSAIALGLLAVALAGITKILGSSSVDMMFGAAAMLVMSVALIAVAGALKILATVPVDSLNDILIALTGIFLALGIGAMIMQTFAGGAIIMAGVLVALSVAILIAAAGVALFAVGMKILGEALPIVGTGLSALSVGMADFAAVASSFAEGVINAGAAVATALLKIASGMAEAAIAGIALAAASIGLAIGLGILALAILIVSGAFLILGGSLALTILLVGGAVTIFGELGRNLIEGFLGGIESMISTTVETITGFVNGVINTFKNLFGIHSPSTVMRVLGQFLGEGFSLGITDSESSVEESATGLGETVMNALGKFVGGQNGDSAFSLGQTFSNMFSSGLGSGSGEVQNANSSFIDKILSQYTKSNSDYEDAGTDNVKHYADGLKNGQSDVPTLFDGSIDEAISSIQKKDTNFEESGESNILSYFSGSLSEWTNGTDITSGNMEDILSNMGGFDSMFSDCGLGNISNYTSGLSDGGSDSVDASSEIASKSAAAVKKSQRDFYEAGVYVAKGLAQGIESQTTTVINAASKLASAASNATRTALQIHSPSKVFYAIGEFAGAGLVNGITSYNNAVDVASADLADSAVNGLRSTISRISSIISSDIDTQPTIRPVMDLSEITAGANSINGMFNMTPSIGAIANVNAISSGMAYGQNGTTNDVVSAISELSKNLGRTSGDTYNINGVTYDDGSNVSDAVRTLVRAARIERRV